MLVPGRELRKMVTAGKRGRKGFLVLLTAPGQDPTEKTWVRQIVEPLVKVLPSTPHHTHTHT